MFKRIFLVLNVLFVILIPIIAIGAIPVNFFIAMNDSYKPISSGFYREWKQIGQRTKNNNLSSFMIEDIKNNHMESDACWKQWREQNRTVSPNTIFLIKDKNGDTIDIASGKITPIGTPNSQKLDDICALNALFFQLLSKHGYSGEDVTYSYKSFEHNDKNIDLLVINQKEHQYLVDDFTFLDYYNYKEFKNMFLASLGTIAGSIGFALFFIQVLQYIFLGFFGYKQLLKPKEESFNSATAHSSTTTNYCSSCGTEAIDGDSFCSNCGAAH